MVAMALSSTMLTKPISTAPPKMVPLDTKSALLPLVLFSRSPTLLLSLLHTPMPPSTRYRNATAIIQTKNNATESTADTFKGLHGSTRRICMLARTGPRGRDDTWMRPSDRTGAVIESSARSPADLRCAARGIGPDRSGSSLAYASFCRLSFCAGAGAGSGSGGGVLATPGAAVPEMNRFKRASALGLAVPRPDCRCWAGEGRATGCLRGDAGASETEPLPIGLSP